MKKTLRPSLSAVLFVALILIIAQFTSCSSHRSLIIIVPPHDTSSHNGNNPGGNPLLLFPRKLTAGTVLVFECASKECADLPNANGSGSAKGNQKIIFEFKLPQDIPANTKLFLSYRPAPGAK